MDTVDFISLGFNILIMLILAGSLFLAFYGLWKGFKKKPKNDENDGYHVKMKLPKSLEWLNTDSKVIAGYIGAVIIGLCFVLALLYLASWSWFHYGQENTIDKEKTNNSFHGYECTEDCSGHEAGYEWAKEHDITQEDVDGYTGNSESFKEGMQSYVDETY